jgi:CBS domain-containing protein
MEAEREDAIITAKDVMSKPVVTVNDGENAARAAQLMEKHKVGGVVVVNSRGRPLGIITERDLSTRVVAKNLQPDKVTVSEIMSRPLATIDGDTSIREVAKRMSRLEIRRLAVVSKKGELEGIVTSKDILRITPALLDVLSEKSRLPLPEQLREPTRLAGYCDMCGEWSDGLAQRDGQFYCDDCLSDMDEQTRPH